ncbi:MAG: cytochrome c biogenesis protein ResB [Dehalococcoidia bacterium]
MVHERQMQVENRDSYEGRDAEGGLSPITPTSSSTATDAPFARDEITVNDPLSCGGYRFHQATYAGDGVALQVRDRRTGAVVFDESPILSRQPASPSPRLVVRDADGAVLHDDFLVLAPLDDRKSIAWVALKDRPRPLLATVFRAADTDAWRLNVVYLRDRANPDDRDFQVTVAEGATERVAGLEFSFAELRGLPSLIVQGIPGIEPVALLQLAQDATGAPTLDVQNLAGRSQDTARLLLRPGEPVVAGDHEYTFAGVRESTGVLVRRDPGSVIIWVATALLIGGLMVTFYVPRRRLWLRVTPAAVSVAGIAERTAHLSEELRRLLDAIAAERQGRAAAGALEASAGDQGH